ncbi:MAG: GNAT family N-acetyltransferase, partial [Hyphomicrobiales bacterium]|nr:GNAT family N-acetyltransferase [Hyphomicrobiales bacterium]
AWKHPLRALPYDEIMGRGTMNTQTLNLAGVGTLELGYLFAFTLSVAAQPLARSAHLQDYLLMQDIRLLSTENIDPDRLATIRVEAMKPSLQALGRFDPERARNRFLKTYDPADTQIVKVGHDLIGFFVVRTRSDHLYLDHIYIQAAHQGSGIGRRIIVSIQERAAQMGLQVRLMALRGSPANAFYMSCGFVLQHSDDLDNYYVWEPNNPASRQKP